MASVEELKARSKAQIDSRFSFKSWLTAAQRTRNLAAEADAKGDLEGAYVGYRKTTKCVGSSLHASCPPRPYRSRGFPMT